MSEFTDELSHLCKARNLSLHALARLSHYDVGYLSKVVNGRKRGSRQLAVALDGTLGADGIIVAAWDRSACSDPGAGSWLPGQPTWPGMAGAYDGLPAMAAADACRSSSDGSDQAAMRSFRAADRQVGGGFLYATVLSYLQAAVAPRLFGGMSMDRGAEVFTAAGALTEMAGWMAHDAGRDEAAGQHLQRALDLARIGGDGQLTAHVLGSMSHLALHQGDPARAVSLACQGQEVLAAAPPNPSVAARLLALQARGLASFPQPDTSACGQALLRAEQALDQELTAPLSPWVSRFDEGSLASEAARCLHKLGQADAAARQARRIIDIRPGEHARSRAFGLLLLASILITQRQPEEACVAGREAFSIAESVSSCLVARQLQALAQAMRTWPCWWLAQTDGASQ